MGNMTLEQVNDMYLDVLREIGNIGAGNATSAIANMLGMKIDMNVPSIRLMEVSQLGMAVGAEDETIVGIFLEVETDIEGSMMFLLDIPSARYLVNKLMMTNEPDDQPFGEMELSALKEIGNIIAGSYLSALSSLTNLVITPSVPYIAVDMAASILSVPAIEFGQYGDNALLIQTEICANVCKAPDVITTLGLGSCIGLVLYDPVTKVGGMVHYMLPDSTKVRNNSNIAKFGDTGIRELLKRVVAAGASKPRLIAKIAGGARMFEVSGLSDVGNIGARNAEAAKAILKELGIRLVAEDTGLNYGRTVELHCDTGEFYIKSVGKPLKII